MARKERLPAWLKRPAPTGKIFTNTSDLLRRLNLHTVCQEAQCPNIGECFNRHVATFLILGDLCTRNCGFCGVKHGTPQPPDPQEPENIAEAAAELSLRHAVITSVNRDDLKDEGASQFIAVIEAVYRRIPSCRVEILTPDFHARDDVVELFGHSLPHIWAHNLETVPRLYSTSRAGAHYQMSLDLLRKIHERFPEVPTKSGIMLGLGETPDEVQQVLQDMRQVGVSMCTIGQYLQPSRNHHPVVEYIHPDRFQDLRKKALEMGFESVMAEPFARSSYHAEG